MMEAGFDLRGGGNLKRFRVSLTLGPGFRNGVMIICWVVLFWQKRIKSRDHQYANTDVCSRHCMTRKFPKVRGGGVYGDDISIVLLSLCYIVWIFPPCFFFYYFYFYSYSYFFPRPLLCSLCFLPSCSFIFEYYFHVHGFYFVPFPNWWGLSVYICMRALVRMGVSSEISRRYRGYVNSQRGFEWEE